MANLVPDSIVCAARVGDAETVRQWLESGGDPNWDLVYPNTHNFPSHYRLLMFAAEHDQRDVMRVLISHGADVNYLYTYVNDPEDPYPGDESEEEDNTERALDVALCTYNDEAALLLIDSGANASRLSSDAWERVLEDHRLLRIVLAAGADFTAPLLEGMTPEESERFGLSLLRVRQSLRQRQHDDYGNTHTQRRIAMYEEAISILEGTRLAGSYKQYVLRDFKGLLRSRSMLARGHALLGPQTPEVVARLFGGSVDPAASRRATCRRRPLPQRAWATFPLPKRLVGVPDPVFWKVMEYWRLGDWRRPSE